MEFCITYKFEITKKTHGELSYIVKHKKHPAPVDSLIISDLKSTFYKYFLCV